MRKQRAKTLRIHWFQRVQPPTVFSLLVSNENILKIGIDIRYLALMYRSKTENVQRKRNLPEEPWHESRSAFANPQYSGFEIRLQFEVVDDPTQSIYESPLARSWSSK